MVASLYVMYIASLYVRATEREVCSFVCVASNSPITGAFLNGITEHEKMNSAGAKLFPDS